ncbi:MAG: hypothetical protein KDD55_13640, partial [Bdellovibrionales bacterium]|nr:hypothetical protein [Bdellovibrionales bacterium]
FLGKKANIPRTTAYSVLDGLVERGIVSEEQEKNTTYFVINNPTSLFRIIEEERKKTDEKENSVKDLIDLISPYFQSKNFSVPKFQFFEGKKNVNNMLYTMSKDWQSAVLKSDRVWWGYQDNSFVDSYRGWLEWYWEMKQEREYIWLLSNVNKTEEELRGKVSDRIIRSVPGNITFSSTIWVLGGEYIVLIMTQQQPHYAFQIRDKVFGANLQSLFELLWGLTSH